MKFATWVYEQGDLEFYDVFTVFIRSSPWLLVFKVCTKGNIEL